jgi:DNA-binding NarL/FixJ family response regulator
MTMSTPPIRLLIVEDELIIALHLRLIVADLGYVVLATVASGEAAIQHVQALRPDLVLMDIGLQGTMDGIAAAEHIWAHWHIPSIFISAYADARTVADAGHVKTLGYIGKPFDAQEIETTLKRACVYLQVDDQDPP